MPVHSCQILITHIEYKAKLINTGRGTLTETKNAKKNRFQEALKSYTQAMTALRKGDYLKSEKLLTALLDKYSTEVELADRARLYLAICAEQKSQKKVVLKTYEDYLYNGIYLMNRGHDKDALNSFDKAAEMKPKEAKVPYLTAINHMLAGNKEECLDSLKNAVEMDELFAVLAQNESDFEPIWKDEDFKAAIQR